jgi:hypothetical protein
MTARTLLVELHADNPDDLPQRVEFDLPSNPGVARVPTIKQVDRMLSNAGVNVDELSERWVPYVVGQRPKIIVAWTGLTLTPIIRRRLCCR